MKTNFYGLIILTITSLIFSKFSKVYKEDAKNIKRRLKWLQSFSEEITDGQIDYVFTPETGIYCVAKKAIRPYDVIYDIPKKYVISFCN